MVLIFGGFLWKGLKLNPAELPSALIGKSVPHFSIPDISHSQKNITETIFKGQVALLHVWSSWCTACQKEAEFIHDIVKNHKLFMVGLIYYDNLKDAKEWLAVKGNPYQINLFDKEGRLAMDFGVYGTPETFVIDKQGIIRYRHVGPLNEALWQQKLLPLINQLN
jgi:cytochrome c biogenesis protein CcmG/thiol:disulfide interchange protein DsbE